MEKKAIYVVAIVAVLVAASVGVYAVVGNKDDVDSPASMEGAELKVLGNANGDRVIDSKDIDVIEKAIDDGVALKDAPLADANNDGVIDAKDIEVVKKIINKESVTVWHINYHDVDGDSTMDMERVSTQYPVSAAIMTVSSISFIMCYMIGIIDEIKGASYGSSNDSTLFGSTYLNTSKTVKLGTSSTSITFEDGKAGSSNVIAEKGVTCVLSDWNRTYLTNESAFETAGVDVVRVAAASVDKEVYTHSILLLGFLFQKESRASDLVDLYDSTMKTIKDAVSTLPEDKKVKAVASSMNGYISSGNSDYQAVLDVAGAEFGLADYSGFGSTTSIKVVDHGSVFNTSLYDWDYIVHIRTALGYGTSAASAKTYWDTYTSAFNAWSHYGEEGSQIMISGAAPVPVRVAYAAYAMYGSVLGELSESWADGVHQTFITDFFNGDNTKLVASDLLICCNSAPA